MKNHELEKGIQRRSSLLQQAVEQETEPVKVQGAPSGEHDSLAQLTCRMGDASCAGAHADQLNHAPEAGATLSGQSLLRLQRQYGNQFVQRVVGLSRKDEEDGQASVDVERAIQGARGGGQALDSGVRAQMEPAFGADFSGVRVHADAQADDLNRSLSARAFTTGQDVFFKQGAYNPGSSGGQELLAHELTHVVQQNGDEVRAKLTVGAPGDRYEQEADQVARAIAQKERDPAQADADDGLVQRQVEEEEEEEEQPVQAKVEEAWIQRQEVGSEDEEEEPIQAKMTQSWTRQQAQVGSLAGALQ